MVGIQEQLDWHVYRLFNLVDAPGVATSAMLPEERPFLAATERVPETVRLIEDRMYKRPWGGRDVRAEARANAYVAALSDSAWRLVLEAAEKSAEGAQAPTARRELARTEAVTSVARCFELADDGQVWASLGEKLAREAVPFLAAYRHTESGLEKRTEWERVWDLQRAEDRGEKVPPFDPPPKYDQKDYRDATSWRLRGKLDVPKERFISYPGCESDEDKEPVYGWAGWNHLQQAQALAALYQKRKTEESWGKERLRPMLAGLLELVPWVKQWHNEPNAEFGGLRLGDYFETFLDGECHALGLTREDLRAWRPAEKGRGRKSVAPAASAAGVEGDESAAPKPRGRGRKKKGASELEGEGE
jgi:hypothetical protein